MPNGRGGQRGSEHRESVAARAIAMPSWLCAALLATRDAFALPKVAIGSKAFPESWILGDALTELVERSGTAVAEHKKNLGGTEIAYQALLSGSIDVYPEYTGTIPEVILKAQGRPGLPEMRRALASAASGSASRSVSTTAMRWRSRPEPRPVSV